MNESFSSYGSPTHVYKYLFSKLFLPQALVFFLSVFIIKPYYIQRQETGEHCFFFLHTISQNRCKSAYPTKLFLSISSGVVFLFCLPFLLLTLYICFKRCNLPFLFYHFSVKLIHILSVPSISAHSGGVISFYFILLFSSFFSSVPLLCKRPFYFYLPLITSHNT